MAYFIRTEESIEDAQKALKRGRSLRGWAHFGCSPWEHLAFAATYDEKVEALQALGYEVYEGKEADRIIHDELAHEDRDADIIEVLGLEPVEGGGYVRYLEGLCAMEMIDEEEPKPEDVDATLYGTRFAYLVCFEGEFIGLDPDEYEWPLFRPTRIVWTHETGSTATRWIETK